MTSDPGSEQPSPRFASFTQAVSLAARRVGSWLKKLGPALRQTGKLLPKALWYAWRFLLPFLLSLLFVLPLVGSFLLMTAWSDLHVPPSEMKPTLWLSIAIATIGLLWLATWLVCSLVARIVGAKGNQLGARAVAFVVTWAFFPSLPKAVVVAVCWGLLQLAVITPGNLLRMAGQPTATAQSAASGATTPQTAGAAAPPSGSPTPQPAGATAPPSGSTAANGAEPQRLIFDVAARFLSALDGELR
jgi:hypothetical protein